MTSNRDRYERIQCEDCGEWFMPKHFLKHWHDVEIPALAYNYSK